MPTSKVWIVAKRDYLSRVKTPGFWIATVAIPLMMGAWIVLPSLIMAKSRGALHLAVVDQTGKLAPRLRDAMTGVRKDGGPGVELRLDTVAPAADVAAQRAALDRRVLRDELDGWLWIGSDVFADNKVEYHARTLSNIITLGPLERAITQVVREQRLAAAGYDPKQVEK